jgi:hypothetical protein
MVAKQGLESPPGGHDDEDHEEGDGDEEGESDIATESGDEEEQDYDIDVDDAGANAGANADADADADANGFSDPDPEPYHDVNEQIHDTRGSNGNRRVINSWHHPMSNRPTRPPPIEDLRESLNQMSEQ